jgi:V8-like Glu-specific endopeptidase
MINSVSWQFLVNNGDRNDSEQFYKYQKRQTKQKEFGCIIKYKSQIYNIEGIKQQFKEKNGQLKNY